MGFFRRGKPPAQVAPPEESAAAAAAEPPVAQPVESDFAVAVDVGALPGAVPEASVDAAGSRAVNPPGGSRAVTPPGGPGKLVTPPGTAPAPRAVTPPGGSRGVTPPGGSRGVTPPSGGLADDAAEAVGNAAGRAAPPPGAGVADDADRAAMIAGLAAAAGLEQLPSTPDRQRPPPLQDMQADDASDKMSTKRSFSTLRNVLRSVKGGSSKKDKTSDSKASSGGFQLRKNYLVSKARSPSAARGIPEINTDKRQKGYANMGQFVKAMRSKPPPAENAQDATADSSALRAAGSPPPSAGDADGQIAARSAAQRQPPGAPLALMNYPASEVALAGPTDLIPWQMQDMEHDMYHENPKMWEQYDAAFELHAAALQNNAARIRYLLQNPDDNLTVKPNLLNEEGETALVAAARAGSAAACVALLDFKADPLSRDVNKNVFGDGIWPHEGKPDWNGKFVDPLKGLDDQLLKLEPGCTAVYHMRLKGIFKTVMARVFPGTANEIARRISESLRQIHECSPVLYAAQEGFPELMDLVCSYCTIGLDRPRDMMQKTDERNKDMAPLRSYVSGFSYSTGRAPTLEPGMRQQQQEEIHWWEKSDFIERGDALIAATLGKNWQTASVLLVAGVPALGVNKCTDKLGRTSLHLAAQDGKTDIVNKLLGNGADTHCRSNLGRQPLHEAVCAGHLATTKVLLDHGADPFSTVTATKLKGYAYSRSGDEGRASLDLASARGQKSVVEHLAARSKVLDAPMSRKNMTASHSSPMLRAR